MKLLFSLMILLTGLGTGLSAYNPDKGDFDKYLKLHGSVVVPSHESSRDSSSHLLFGSVPRPDSNAIFRKDYKFFSVFIVRSTYGDVTVEKQYAGVGGHFLLVD